MAYQLTDSIQILPGIGPARAKRLEKLGILSLRDLLFWFPRNYEDRRELFSIAEAPEDRSVCVRAMVATPPRATHIRKGLELVKVSVVDDRETMEITFFNQEYLRNTFTIGSVFRFYGKVEKSGKDRYTMTSPAYEPYVEGRSLPVLFPVYPLTEGISNKMITGHIGLSLSAAAQVEDPLPEHIRAAEELCTLGYALRTLHAPEDFAALHRAVLPLFLWEASIPFSSRDVCRHNGSILT